LSQPLAPAKLEQALDKAANVIANIVLENATAPATQTTIHKGGYEAVTRLLDRIDHPLSGSLEIGKIRQSIQTLRKDVDLIAEVDRAAEIISIELSKNGDSDQCTSARDHLLLLMNLIPFPASLTGRSSKTRRSIENAATPAALYGCIPEIADLTVMMRLQFQAEIDELGEFLKSTLTRLRDVEAQIKHSNSFHDESVEHAFNLERSMGEHTNGLRSDIDDEMDIAAIKTAVNSHLEKIDESLGEFIQVEDERHTQARERITHMVSALNELEFETKELRDNLEKQHEQVLIDPLTGILNRTGYNEKINKEFVRWRRYDARLSVAVIDLDRFKNINDTYGHSTGDKVLATIARQISGQIRECDIFCRYGGEEFVLLLPETSMDDAIGLVEKLRVYISECNFHFQQTPVPVTTSCGVAEFHKDDTIEDVFDRAD
jgi:diguanylate cyclase